MFSGLSLEKDNAVLDVSVARLSDGSLTMPVPQQDRIRQQLLVVDFRVAVVLVASGCDSDAFDVRDVKQTECQTAQDFEQTRVDAA